MNAGELGSGTFSYLKPIDFLESYFRSFEENKEVMIVECHGLTSLNMLAVYGYVNHCNFDVIVEHDDERSVFKFDSETSKRTPVVIFGDFSHVATDSNSYNNEGFIEGHEKKVREMIARYIKISIKTYERPSAGFKFKVAAKFTPVEVVEL